MAASFLVSTVQATGVCFMVLGFLVPIKDRLNAAAYLGIEADHEPQFITTLQPSTSGHFQQNNAMYHRYENRGRVVHGRFIHS